MNNNKENITEQEEYNYMLLSRLKEDCNYFLGNGGKSEKILWAGSVKGQINEMKKLYNILKIKPEWLSMKDIEEYNNKMK